MAERGFDYRRSEPFLRLENCAELKGVYIVNPLCKMFFYRYIKRRYVLNPVHEKQEEYIVLLYKKREKLTANNKKMHKNLRKISAENY